MTPLQRRVRAALIHLSLSAAIAGLAAVVVFGLWYPYPYRSLSGGRDLFLLLTVVDVVMGPLITLAIFNPRKSRREIRMDVGCVGALQVAALAYGMWTVAVARPVHLAFEVDRFRAIHAIEIDSSLLPQAPVGLRELPWMGPGHVSVRPFKSSQQQADATLAALAGVHLGARPDLWEPYSSAKERVIAAGKPVDELRNRFPRNASEIDLSLQNAGVPPARALFIPMVGRNTFWTVLIDAADARVLAFLPLDSF